MWMLMEDMSASIQLNLVYQQNEVEVEPAVGEDTLDLFIGPKANVEAHEPAKGSAWRAAYNPSGFLGLHELESLHPVCFQGKVTC